MSDVYPRFHPEMAVFCDNLSIPLSWGNICSAWRNGIHDVRISYTGDENNVDRSRHKEKIPMHLHLDMMKAIKRGIENDNPPNISLGGNKDSFLQLAVPFPSPRAYTLCFWLKFMDDNLTNESVSLSRCRSPQGSFDVDLKLVNKADHQWLVVLRGNSVEPHSYITANLEVSGHVSITPGKWHLISLRHSCSPSKAPKITFILDGNLEFEENVPYPFANTTVESNWIFGLNFKGLISSVAMYAEDISLPLLSLLYSKGPHSPTFTSGVIGTPQVSFDSGHQTLGTMYAKGQSALKACKFAPLFSITAYHFISMANLPQMVPGRQNVEHIEMVMRDSNDSTTADGNHLTPCMNGSCLLNISTIYDDYAHRSWCESINSVGGCLLFLYILNEYVQCGNSVIRSQRAQSSSIKDSIEADNESLNYHIADSSNETLINSSTMMVHVRFIVSLVSSLIESCAESKEQFLQVHGFHVVGACFAKLENKRELITKDFVDCCMQLCLSLGADALKGDGINSALQGLLFDYRVWGECESDVKLYLLNGVYNLVGSSGGDHLFRSIGLQRLLDVFRLYICPNNLPTPSSTNRMGSSISAQNFASNSSQGNVLTCGEAVALQTDAADACVRLINVVIDAGLTAATKARNALPVIRTPAILFGREAEILCLCLEEAQAGLVVERVLRILASLRTRAASAVLQAFVDSRFAETTAVTLLTTAGYSAEVRRETVINVLWTLGEQLKHIPLQLSQFRKSNRGFISPSSLGSFGLFLNQSLSHTQNQASLIGKGASRILRSRSGGLSPLVSPAPKTKRNSIGQSFVANKVSIVLLLTYNFLLLSLVPLKGIVFSLILAYIF